MPVEHVEYVDRALSLVSKARGAGIELRILGSLAYRLHCPANIALFEEMKRDLTDIDFAASGRQRKEVRTFLEGLGYVIDQDLLVTTEGARFAFTEPRTGMIVDVFFDELNFCHPIPLRDRLSLDYPTITPTDLLLEKTQIVEINPKDIKDSIILLLEHQLDADQTDAIDGVYIAQLLAADWGFYYTVSQNLDRLRRELESPSGLTPAQAQVVRERIDRLADLVEKAPKTRKWKLRARIGPRVKWYQEVAEKSETY
jgi:hypothetical protein